MPARIPLWTHLRIHLDVATVAEREAYQEARWQGARLGSGAILLIRILKFLVPFAALYMAWLLLTPARDFVASLDEGTGVRIRYPR